jgi:hypothetical protein
METNYIIVDYSGTAHGKIDIKTKELLKSVKPKGCPFYDYSMWDLLSDWIKMYSWQLERNKKIALEDFIRWIRVDGKEVYKDVMINLLKLQLV